MYVYMYAYILHTYAYIYIHIHRVRALEPCFRVFGPTASCAGLRSDTHLTSRHHPGKSRKYRRAVRCRDTLKDQGNHEIGAIYHILFKSYYEIWMINLFKDHLVLKDWPLSTRNSSRA